MKNPISYSLTLMKNQMRPEDAPKAYPNIQLTSVLSLEDLAAHIHDHDSVYSKGVILGVLTDMTHCVAEALSEGNAVILGDLGRFDPSIKAEGSEASEATETQPARTAMENFGKENIKALRVNFTPGDGCEFDLEKIDFVFVTTRKAQAAAKKAQKLGQKSADWSDPEDDGEGDGD